MKRLLGPLFSLTMVSLLVGGSTTFAAARPASAGHRFKATFHETLLVAYPTPGLQIVQAVITGTGTVKGYGAAKRGRRRQPGSLSDSVRGRQRRRSVDPPNHASARDARPASERNPLPDAGGTHDQGLVQGRRRCEHRRVRGCEGPRRRSRGRCQRYGDRQGQAEAGKARLTTSFGQAHGPAPCARRKAVGVLHASVAGDM